MDFILVKDEKEASNWRIYDKKIGKQLTNDFEMDFIEFPKWKIYKDVKEMNSSEKWMNYFDKKTEKEELEEILKQAPMVKEAIKREKLFTQDEIRRCKYDLIEKAERDRRDQMAYAVKQGIEQGKYKGRAQLISYFTTKIFP